MIPCQGREGCTNPTDAWWRTEWEPRIGLCDDCHDYYTSRDDTPRFEPICDKVCSRCYQRLPAEAFGGSTGRLRSQCHACRARTEADLTAARFALVVAPTAKQLTQAYQAGLAACGLDGTNTAARCPYVEADPRHSVWQRGRGAKRVSSRLAPHPTEA